MTIPKDALNQLLNGGRPEVVPVAPVYEGLGALQSHWLGLRWRKWRQRLEDAGRELLAVSYGQYLGLELEILTDTLDEVYLPPAWLGLPRNRVEAEVAGCAVMRRGEELFWLDSDGGASWMPPSLAAEREAEIAEGRHRYAHLWEGGHHAADLESILTEPAHDAGVLPEPTEEQAEAVAAGGRYEIGKRLVARYRDNLPLYYYGISPYGSLLGMLGFQQMMYAMVESPELVHRVLESRLPRETADLAGARKLGVGIVFVEECLASADLISPVMYQEFVFPYTKRALEFYEEQGLRTVLYFSGNLMPFLSYLRELPFTALSFEEDRKNYGIDLGEVRRVMGAERVLFGNLDAHFVERATEEAVLVEVRRQVQVAGTEGNFVVSPGSPFTPETSLARVRLVCESTRRL
jgi:hypothetical protein